MKPEIKGIVEALRKLKAGGSSENRPKGIPEPGTNADTAAVEGAYAAEDLGDPGIVNQVTGSGGGPVIGRVTRGSGKGGC